MKQQVSTLIILGLFSVSMFSCSHSVDKETQKTKEDTEMNTKTTAGPPVFIYKTKKDYYQHVPIVLSEDKTRVVSFPGIKDVVKNNIPTYPTRLENGYLLDNRGISKNAVFLSLTYEEYSKLRKTPSAEDLLEMILDKDPFVELYNCGSRYNYENLVAELNDKITTKKLSDFNKLK